MRALGRALLALVVVALVALWALPLAIVGYGGHWRAMRYPH